MTEIKEICGFLDDSGKFWKTQEEALESNKEIKESNLYKKVERLLDEEFGRNAFYASRREISFSTLAHRMFDHPEKFLTILWEVTKYKFNKKFTES